MKLIIVRHGDPDYENDSLTEKGFVEAELLSNLLAKINIDEFYCSTLGRAKDTAAPTLKKHGAKADYVEWLREFNYAKIHDPENAGNMKQIWDFTPKFWTEFPELFDKDKWLTVDFIRNSDVPAAYKSVCNGVDEVLRKNGYNRTNNYYAAENSNHKTIAFFCHLGTEAMVLSHILNTSPFIFTQNFFVAPTSVTTLITEERKKGEASFRCQAMGDISHLYAANEQPSFSGRFAECFTDDTRH